MDKINIIAGVLIILTMLISSGKSVLRMQLSTATGWDLLILSFKIIAKLGIIGFVLYALNS